MKIYCEVQILIYLGWQWFVKNKPISSNKSSSLFIFDCKYCNDKVVLIGKNSVDTSTKVYVQIISLSLTNDRTLVKNNILFFMKGLKIMKYFSEKLNKVFESEQECVEAENKLELEEKEKAEKEKQLAETRKERAREIEEQYKKIMDDRKEYQRMINDFVQDYGGFHCTFKSNEPIFSDMDFFDLLKYAFTW